MKPDENMKLADQKAIAARTQFLATLTTAGNRLRPAALRKEASEKAMDTALDGIAQTRGYVRKHPIQVLAVAAGIGAFIGRAPLTALFRRLFVMGMESYRHYQSRKD